jgi:hypothetical protein
VIQNAVQTDSAVAVYDKEVVHMTRVVGVRLDGVLFVRIGDFKFIPLADYARQYHSHTLTIAV